MTATAGFDDRAVIEQVIELFDEMRQNPIASRLASIEFGSIDFWSAFQYEIADLLYDHVWRQTTPESAVALETVTPENDGFVGRLRDNLWQGMWGQQLLSGLLEQIGALDLLEATQFVWRSLLDKPSTSAPIAVVGFANRSGLMKLVPAASQILLHDDNLSRHRRAFRSTKYQLIAGESLLRTSDYKKASQRAKDIYAILSPRETRGVRFSEVFRRFNSKSARRRGFRRLYLGAEALGRFMTSGVVKTFVIPDERQPLAKAAAAMARTCSSAKVVSVLEPVDQYVRKMPYWGDIVSDVVVVTGGMVRRNLTRSGISDQKFRTCSFPGLKSLLDVVAAPSHVIATGESRQPTVLYCDQGLPGSAERFTRLVDCLGHPPRAKLVFRPHPVQSTLLLRLVVRGGRIVRSQSIVEAIRCCDVLVTHSSMVATVAALMERPVILWNPAAAPTMPVLLLESVAYWARTHEELAQLITLFLNSGSDHPFRRNQVTFRRELASTGSEADLTSLLS